MTGKAWGGVFHEATDRRVEAFTESISFDHRLFAQDVRASVAHAQMLCHSGLISSQECDQIVHGLHAIEQQIAQGKFEFRTELEDIHMHIERALIDRIGDTGRKLHTARSRNDQVSTDLRLWVRDAIDQLDLRLVELQRAFLGRVETDRGVILPAYTHLQRAQPVLAGHYWLAYCEKLQRDRDRLADARRRTNVLTLGTAAVAGTTLPIDRDLVAQALGFEGVAANSLDASSDRDFVVEFAFVSALIAEHLSTWAEEWILWSTSEFSFLELPQTFCTGSSIMPQKINPDVLELTRGKTARVIGNLQALLVLLKGLPLAYNRDLQEDKQRVFDTFDTVEACLALAAPLVAGAKLRREAIAQRIDRGYMDATTLMEHLIRLQIPQRTAHEIVGGLVRRAMQLGQRLADLELAEFQAAHPVLDASVYDVLGVDKAVAAFCSVGSTAPDQVEHQATLWRARLGVEPSAQRVASHPAAALS